MKEEHLIPRLKLAIALFAVSIPIMLILPFFFKNWKLPIAPIEFILFIIKPLFIIALIFAVINAIRIGRRVQKIKMTREEFAKAEFWKISLGFMVIISMAFIIGMLGDLIESTKRIEFKNFLTSVSTNKSVYIDEKLHKDPNGVIEQLKNIKWMPGHRSHPTNRIYVKIADNDKSVTILVRRDSDEPTEYWIFYPVTSKLEIGRIYTNIFDSN